MIIYKAFNKKLKEFQNIPYRYSAPMGDSESVEWIAGVTDARFIKLVGRDTICDGDVFYGEPTPIDGDRYIVARWDEMFGFLFTDVYGEIYDHDLGLSVIDGYEYVGNIKEYKIQKMMKEKYPDVF